MRSSTGIRHNRHRPRQAAVPALVPDRRLQGAPRPWILREEFPRAALLEVDHQEARAREGALQMMEKSCQRTPEMRRRQRLCRRPKP